MVLSLVSQGAFVVNAQLTGSVPQTFTGTLFDAARAACGPETKGTSSPGTCPVTICTANFGVRLPDGKLYKLDEGGNTKAADALRRSRKGSAAVISYWKTGKASQPVSARVTGTLTSEVLNVESIQID